MAVSERDVVTKSSPCPSTFHPCLVSVDDAGFSVLDRRTGKETPATSEADARRIAERDYPSCEFALSTVARIHPSATNMDVVIMAVIAPGVDDRRTLVAYVIASVATASCTPFSQAVWPHIKDNLPHDHRRPTTILS